MRYKNRFLSLLLTLAMTLSLCAPAFAREERVRAVVTAENARALELAAATPGVDLLWRYERLFTGAAVEATESALECIAAIPGVTGVAVTAQRAAQAEEAPLTESNSLEAMGGAQLPYDGDGTVIAVIDSGLRYSHEAFADYGQTDEPAIREEDIAAFIESGGTEGRYISPRIPFAYDYCHGDDEVMTENDHGTHVSALAVGYAEDETGRVIFRGVAPAAQLLAMKVFPDRGSGADDADVLRALEDALALGADVVNLSLGVDSGFVATESIGAVYRQALHALEEAGTVICCAVGNGGYALMDLELYPTADYTDYGTLSYPSVHSACIAVAAANADTYEARGYIEAGQRQIPYASAVTSTGTALPAPERLAGRQLTYAVVEGVGSAADFAAANVAGRVALVERGIISFEEKTRNAAEAGAVACLVRNNNDENITPLLDGADIPCMLISKEDGAYLLELAGADGRGSLTLRDERYLVHRDETAMMDVSAWGTASDLQLSPALTAPGGDILSAGVESDSAYKTLSGTSMAAPNAAGAFLLLLQQLKEDGTGEGAARVSRAAAALESTARLIRTEGGTPLSPRQQGAGLIDLQSALETELLIGQPLLELGEIGGDSFTLTFRVENRGEKDAVCRVDTTVLTDNFEQMGETWYSLLSPRDITAGCRIAGTESVTVPAGQSREVRLTVTLSRELLAELEPVFTNGFFTEGYVTVTAADGQTAHATFLGYRGDWEAAPVIEQTDFRHALAAERTLWEETGSTLAELGLEYAELVGANMGVNLVWRGGYDFDTTALLGDDPRAAEVYLEDRAAIATTESNAVYSEGSIFFLDVYTLRNADRLIMVISDSATGQVYYAQEYAQLPRSGMNDLLTGTATSARFVWNGTTEGGAVLSDGTRVNVDFYAWPESDSAARTAYESRGTTPADPDTYYWLRGCSQWRELSFSLTVDRSAPTLTAEKRGDQTEVRLRDNRYLAWVEVRGGDGALLGEEHFADERAGVIHELTGAWEDAVYITASDYAGNLAAWRLEDGEIRPCAAALLEDMTPDSWYFDAVDEAWSAGWMEPWEGRTFAPQRDATRAVLVKALYARAGSPAPKGAQTAFLDVEGGADYRTALNWAVTEGIVQGFSTTTFGGHATVNRQQLAVMLHRYAGEPEATGTIDAFTDSGDAAHWAESALAWAVSEGYLTGYPDGTLRPEGQVSRAELAQVLTRLRGE